jgi:putative phage-type endonuclease
MTARLLGCWPDRSPEWHAARAGRVGGSDVGVICGWSTFTTRDDLLAEKVWDLPPTPSSKAQDRGVYLEPAIMQWLADAEVVTWQPSLRGTYVDSENDWMLCNPDGLTLSRQILGEAKTTAVRDAEHGWGRAGTDQVPLAYAAQCQWGMGIVGAESCLLGVLSGAPRFEFARYRIKFDRDVFDYLKFQAAAFLAEVTSQKEQAA